MRRKKEKILRKQWLELNQKPQYNIKGRVVEGITFRHFKKLKEVDRKASLT